MRRTLKIVFQILVFCTPYIYTPIFGQESGEQSLDSLRGMSYEKLKSSFDENTHNKAIAGLYANAYLRKAKRDRDTFRIADGYLFFVNIQMDKKQALEYTDSIILVTNSSDRFESQFAEGLFQKGMVLHSLSLNKEALEYYVKANVIFSERKDFIQKLRIRHSIGLLKNNIDNEKEALELFKTNFQILESDSMKRKYKTKYLIALYALADCYNRNHIIDSSEYYSRLGLLESRRQKNKLLYSYFLISFGSSKYQQREYGAALDSLIKGASSIENRTKAKCDGYLMISDVYDSLNNSKLSIHYLKKIDSIYDIDKEVYEQAGSANKRLLKHYQRSNKASKQIEAINRIIYLDSIFDVNNKDLNKKILKEYELPLLLNEKQKLINSLNQSKTALSYKLRWFLTLLILAVVLMSFFFYRQRLYKSNFETISNKLIENQKLNKKKSEKKLGKDLSKEQVEIIMQRIDNFEKELGFLEKNISLQILSIRLKTNSSYLSKVFNQHKKQKLADYLNELRISYALEVLPKDKKLQQYTIKALASEFGYNTAESFSKAFFKRTEVYPSYYIKQLLEQSPTE